MRPAEQRQAEPERPDDVDPPGPARRLPVRGGGPGEGDGDDPDRDVDVEHPAPGRVEDRRGRAGQAGRLEGLGGVDRGEDRRPDDRPGRHAEEGQRADHAERARSSRAAEQVRRRRRPDRDQHAATDRLDQPGGDELVERLRGTGQRRAHREDDERADEQAASAPQVGQPAGHRHRQDVDQQIAVDDPARLAQLDPGGAAGGIGKVGQDRRQRDRGDQQLHPGQEDAEPDDGEQDQPGASGHVRECIEVRRRQRSAQAPLRVASAIRRRTRPETETDASRMSTAHLVDHQGGQGCHPRRVREALGEHQEHQRPRGTQAVEPVAEPEAPECRPSQRSSTASPPSGAGRPPGCVVCPGRIASRRQAPGRRPRSATAVRPARAWHRRRGGATIVTEEGEETEHRPRRPRKPRGTRRARRTTAQRRRPFCCHLDGIDRGETRGHHHRRDHHDPADEEQHRRDRERWPVLDQRVVVEAARDTGQVGGEDHRPAPPATSAGAMIERLSRGRPMSRRSRPRPRRSRGCSRTAGSSRPGRPARPAGRRWRRGGRCA